MAIVEFSEDEAQLRWLLLDLGVRSRGIGRQLVEEALKFCRIAGYSFVFLWTVEALKVATNLYQSFGSYEGRYRLDYIPTNGRWIRRPTTDT